MPTALTSDESALVVDALAKAASRHEAQARSLKPGAFSTEHDHKAVLMRRLRARLMKQERGPS